MTRTKARRGNHYCLDEIGDSTWTVQRDPARDRDFVVCAVCGRPRGETINERDAMKRRLHALASNLRVAAGLCEAYRLGERNPGGRWEDFPKTLGKVYFANEKWRPGCGKESP